MITIKLLLISTITLLFLPISSFAMSQKNPVEDGTRKIRLYNTLNMQYLDITYFKNEIYQVSALNRINNIFVDKISGDIFKINPALLDILLKIQVEANIDKPLYIVTGYKSKKSNPKDYKDDENKADFIAHSHGKALDFYIKDFPLEQLRDIALKFSPENVKMNKKLGYIHIDIKALSKVDPNLLTDTNEPNVSPIETTETPEP